MSRPGWMAGHCKKKIATRSLLIEHLLCAQHPSALTFQDCLLPERIFPFVTRCHWWQIVYLGEANTF